MLDGAPAGVFYERFSRLYDWLTWAERRFTREAVDSLALVDGETVAEIGAGPGHGLQALAAAVGPRGRVVGVDLAEGMLSLAHRRLGDLAQVSLVQGDAQSWPLRDNCVDAVLFCYTLELFDDIVVRTVLTECRRVLRKTGRVAVLALGQAERESLATRLYAAARRRWPNWVDCRPLTIAPALSACGFEIKRVERWSAWGLPIELTVAHVPAAG